jgi:hypothetical protein
MRAIAPKFLTVERQLYLTSPVRQFGLAAVLGSVYIYGILTNPDPMVYSFYVVLLVALAAVVAVAQGPRWAVYGVLFAALVIYLFVFVHIVANGEQDQQSTRDDAVEITARALLRGQNAWNDNPGVVATTGPASILVALPFVLLFDKTNWLTFLFWILFFLILLWGDLRYRNHTWPVMVMLCIAGSYGFEHTLYWSLEELYYPFVYLALAYLLAAQRQWWLVGALLAASVLTRSSYAFMLLGFGFWYLFSGQARWRDILKIGAGFVFCCVVVVLPFIIIGGRDFWTNNPWRVAFEFSGVTWFDSNLVFRTLNQLYARVGPGMMRWFKLGVTVLIIGGMSWALRRAKVQHPFWHITVAAALAHTFAWLPVPPGQYPLDYTLMVVMPALLAVASTPGSVSGEHLSHTPGLFS